MKYKELLTNIFLCQQGPRGQLIQRWNVSRKAGLPLRHVIGARFIKINSNFPLRISLQAAFNIYDNSKWQVQARHTAVPLYLRLSPRHLEPRLVCQHYPHRSLELHAGEKSNPRLCGNVRLREETVCSQAKRDLKKFL